MQIAINDIVIRPIEFKDNERIAKVIRDTLAEFGANHEGTVYYDPTTDHLYELFRKDGSIYNVVEQNGKILGGGGIFPSDGLPTDTCELVKMYLEPEARGQGLGSRMIQLCIDAAKENGFSFIYLETMPELKQALKTYEKFGFEYLNGPMGNTGHFGCQLWMKKKIL